jgi:hypothetical protein
VVLQRWVGLRHSPLPRRACAGPRRCWRIHVDASSDERVVGEGLQRVERSERVERERERKERNGLNCQGECWSLVVSRLDRSSPPWVGLGGWQNREERAVGTEIPGRRREHRLKDLAEAKGGWRAQGLLFCVKRVCESEGKGPTAEVSEVSEVNRE